MTSKRIELLGRVEWINEKGEMHRLDGPALEFSNGSREWWIEGKRHRVDGPAMDYAVGYKAWYLNGIHYSPEEWLNALTKDQRIAYLFNMEEPR